ncbi:hypothetical protein [Desulfogranum japonicum]|uniref:hypothetical protein n=1 Tax=Desulfogranum japonicum TaxID=231447 RepID=UPI0004148418|nr:hypothetical protein [Desulfogranum japonicum]
MEVPPITTFQDAIKRLARFGIEEQHIYLVDLVILAEMAWADECIQQAEVELLVDYMLDHVQEINQLAGCLVLDEYMAADFVAELLGQKPEPSMLHAMRQAFIPIRLANKSQQEAEDITANLLSACLDIAASSVTKYPYGLKERFTREEKSYFHALQRLLSQAL